MSEDRIEYEPTTRDRHDAIRATLLDEAESAIKYKDDGELPGALLQAAQLYQAYALGRIADRLEEIADRLEEEIQRALDRLPGAG